METKKTIDDKVEITEKEFSKLVLTAMRTLEKDVVSITNAYQSQINNLLNLKADYNDLYLDMQDDKKIYHLKFYQRENNVWYEHNGVKVYGFHDTNKEK